MKISEIFVSIQGEGVETGLPTAFIRTAGCNLNCSWCDAEYAKQGREMSVSQAIKECGKFGIKRVCITGGEPLIQEDFYSLVEELLAKDYKIIVETNGSVNIEKIPKQVRISLDIKCPGSKEHDKMLYQNLDLIKKTDQVKFIVGDNKDYEFAKEVIKKYGLEEKTNVIFQGVYESGFNAKLIKNILKDKLNARFSLQVHKAIWGDVRGR